MATRRLGTWGVLLALDVLGRAFGAAGGPPGFAYSALCAVAKDETRYAREWVSSAVYRQGVPRALL